MKALFLLVHSFSDLSSFYVAQRLYKNRIKESETMVQKADFTYNYSATVGTYLLWKARAILILL